VLLLRNPDIAALLAARLRPLRDRPDLLQTLRVYLKCGMSARAAARALFVHQNTVPYRLRTIERLLGRNLDDVTALSDVILALRGLELEEADGAHAPAPLEAI
jgi:DNA-binding PucR family transcriptional regulator